MTIFFCLTFFVFFFSREKSEMSRLENCAILCLVKVTSFFISLINPTWMISRIIAAHIVENTIIIILKN